MKPLLWLAFALGVTGCQKAHGPPPKSQTSFLVGQPVPSFRTETMSGKPIDSETFPGKPVVITFVATDCKPCEQTLLAVESAFNHYEDVAVFAIVQHEGSRKAQSLAARLGLSYPVAIDHDGTITRQFRVTEVPRTFVVDAGNLVRWVGGPALTDSELGSAIEAFPRR